MAEYLNQKKSDDDHLVQDFAFMSSEYHAALRMGSEHGTDTIFSDASSLSMPQVEMYSVPANFFNVVNADYYVQSGLQDGVPNIETLSNGDANPVQMLYSDEDLSPYPATEENINNKNAYNITFRNWQWSPYYAQAGTEKTYGVVIPSALATNMALEAGDVVKF